MNFSFKIKIYLPTIQKYIFVKQFNNLTYKTLLKHLANKNAETFNDYINNLLAEHCDYDTSQLNFIDKFVILLNLRCISIGDTLSHTIQKEVSKYNLKYNIYDVIKNITDKGFIKSNKIIHYKNCSIKMCVPKNLFIDIQEPGNFIDYITIGEKIFKLDDLTENDKTEAINLLPGNILYELYDEIQIITTSINKIELTKFKVDVDSTELHTLNLYLDKDNMFSILNIFFNELLTNLFIKQFILSKEYHVSCEYFDSLPPIESEIMYNFHKEIEQKMNEENRPSNKGPNIPGIPGGGVD
jgi:hypothetical protein